VKSLNAFKKKENKELLKFPELPTNLELGKQIVNWGGNSAFDGNYDQRENVFNKIPSGKVKVLLHTHGIRIVGDIYMPLLDIHNSQIISLKITSQEELSKIDKSVIGRAVVGGLILGPIGAIIGGISGIGSKEKIANTYYLVFNFWDNETKDAKTLLISGDKLFIQAFINRNEKEKAINETENRKPEKDVLPIGGVIAFSLIFISILVIIYQLIFS